MDLKNFELPSTLKFIELSAFENSGIKELVYPGTKEQWNTKVRVWFSSNIITKIHCSDGVLELNE